jgi:hypothetical protein
MVRAIEHEQAGFMPMKVMVCVARTARPGRAGVRSGRSGFERKHRAGLRIA